MVSNEMGSENVQKYLYFLNCDQKTEKIGEIFISDFNNLAETYIKEKFNSKLNITDKKKTEIQNDINSPNEYYLFSNNSLYKKETEESKGYLWNSATYMMKKVGKFIVIDIEIPKPTQSIQPISETQTQNQTQNQTETPYQIQTQTQTPSQPINSLNNNSTKLMKQNQKYINKQKRISQRHNFLIQRRNFNKKRFRRQQCYK